MLPENYLSEHMDFDTHQYAVVDRVLFNQLPEALPAIELVTPLTVSQTHIYPWLIPLREIGGSQWRNLLSDIRLASDPEKMPVICLLLKSELSPDAMKNSLLSMLFMMDEYKRQHILRFYDPRVLFHLHWMLRPWEFRSRFNTREIPVWTFWLEGRWHTLAFEQYPFFDASTATTPFNQIQHVGLINQVLAGLPLNPDISARQETSRRIDAILEQCPLFTDADKVAFATQGVLYGEEFWKTKKMTELLKEARSEPGYYARLTSGWSDADWQDSLNENKQQVRRG
ncbi:MAG: DUF4123 domain-containing protein [Yokenella regensburgei]|jgi:hypothetical protein|nr:DUF4123 domain-containing protein [Yokenella regensburgei]